MERKEQIKQHDSEFYQSCIIQVGNNEDVIDNFICLLEQCFSDAVYDHDYLQWLADNNDLSSMLQDAISDDMDYYAYYNFYDLAGSNYGATVTIDCMAFDYIKFVANIYSDKELSEKLKTLVGKPLPSNEDLNKLFDSTLTVDSNDDYADYDEDTISYVFSNCNASSFTLFSVNNIVTEFIV